MDDVAISSQLPVMLVAGLGEEPSEVGLTLQLVSDTTANASERIDREERLDNVAGAGIMA
jgi:hypothetical protein